MKTIVNLSLKSRRVSIMIDQIEALEEHCLSVGTTHVYTIHRELPYNVDQTVEEIIEALGMK